MPGAYSHDLRCRVLLHYLANRSVSWISKRMYISKSTVRRIVHTFQSTGDIEPREQRHGPNRMLSDFELITILQMLLEEPGIYLREVQARLQEIGSQISLPTLCRTAKRLGLTRQVMRRVMVQRTDVQRARFLCDIQQFKPEHFVFVDETGSNRRNSLRKYGYGIRGLTPVSHQIRIHSQRITAIGVMSQRGIEDAYITKKSVNAEVFLRFVQRCLLPIIQPFDGVNPRSIVVLDNATIHHCKQVVNLISAAGSLVFYLPPYSPDLMPIEELFSKVKSYIRDNEKAYQSTHSPELIVAHAFASITQQDCIGYMTHAGYI